MAESEEADRINEPRDSREGQEREWQRIVPRQWGMAWARVPSGALGRRGTAPPV